MKKMTIGSWTMCVAGIVAFSAVITVGILLDPVNPELQKSQVYEQGKLYKDYGFGVMAIYGCDSGDKMECGYSQWKEDYPERAKKIVACAMGTYRLTGDHFVLIYETE